MRRHKSDDADLDFLLGASSVRHHAVQNLIRFHLAQPLILLRCGAQCAGRNIGANNRKIRPVKHGFEEIETVIEFVIAKGRGVEAEQIHRRYDRVNIPGGHAALIGDIVTHRIALKEVSIVDQHAVSSFGTNISDQGRCACQPDRITRPVAIIIIGIDMNMQIGGFHDPQMCLMGTGKNGKRMKHGNGGRPGTGKKGAARD